MEGEKRVNCEKCEKAIMGHECSEDIKDYMNKVGEGALLSNRYICEQIVDITNHLRVLDECQIEGSLDLISHGFSGSEIISLLSAMKEAEAKIVHDIAYPEEALLKKAEPHRNTTRSFIEKRYGK